MRRNAKDIFLVEQHTLSSTFHIGDSVAIWSDVLSQIRTWALVILEMPVDMPFGQTVSGRQRCSDSVSQACQLPSSSEGIVFSADPASITLGELHLCLRTIGTLLKSTEMCCQTRSPTITSPRIVNNCLSLSIIVLQGISDTAMIYDHFENV
ncbi:hypothetical protein T09_3220 [Trichinella sp. T9]|nr:hypothetical protein T09_3220 [Trichinella sp. T9]